MLESRLSLRISHVQWTCNRLGQRAWSTHFLKYERSIVKKGYSIFLHRHLNFSFSKRMYNIWRDQARGWTWMLGQGTPAGTRHRPAQNSTLGMIGFENNCFKKDKWKKEEIYTYTFWVAKFFRRSAAPSAISGLCPSLSRGKFTEHVLSAENFIMWMLRTFNKRGIKRIRVAFCAAN